MIKVYIASPYTIGDVAVNVKQQIDTASELMDLGYIPFAPLLSHFIHLVHPKEYDQWMAYDFAWIDSCDYLLRLSGESRGADLEVEYAIKKGIPVVEHIKFLPT